MAGMNLGGASKRTLLAALLAVAAPTATSIARSAEPAYPARMLNGLETARLDETKITVVRGSATDNTGRYLITIDRTLTADIMTVGEFGRDDKPTPEDLAERRDVLQPDAAAPTGYRARYREGHAMAGKPLSGWYTPVYAADADGNPAIFLTRQQSSQRNDREGDAAIPNAFRARRNAPIAFYYDAETGFRPMTCYGWPKPFCVWTRIPPYERGLTIAKSTAPATLKAVDARTFVPPTGRLLRLQIIVRGDRGAGSVRLYTLPRGEGLLAGHVNQKGDVSLNTFDLALTSDGTFYYTADDGLSVEMTALGFSMLQPN